LGYEQLAAQQQFIENVWCTSLLKVVFPTQKRARHTYWNLYNAKVLLDIEETFVFSLIWQPQQASLSSE